MIVELAMFTQTCAGYRIKKAVCVLFYTVLLEKMCFQKDLQRAVRRKKSSRR